MIEITEKILKADYHDPFAVLGVHFHKSASGTATIRTFQPHAKQVELLLDGKELAMKCVHHDGLFAIDVDSGKVRDPDLTAFNYQYRITFQDGVVQTINDPYRFLPQLDMLSLG